MMQSISGKGVEILIRGVEETGVGELGRGGVDFLLGDEIFGKDLKEKGDRSLDNVRYFPFEESVGHAESLNEIHRRRG